MIETALFFALAAATVVSAVLVIVQRNAVSSAVFLVLTLFCLAGISLLLQAPFIAAVQVLVYAGGIMVLFLFVIMLLNPDREQRGASRPRLAKAAGVALGAVLLVQMAVVFTTAALTRPGAGAGPAPGNTEALARLLFTDYLLPFEVTSVLLLAAIIGATILAKREI